MSIDSEQRVQDSITEGDLALNLFTDRYSFTRLLAERLNEPAAKEILFFHGAGGNGKSLLLKHLQQNVCKRLTAQQWQQVKALPDDELASWLENFPTEDGRLSVPAVLLDFGSRPALNEVQPKDRFYGLLVLRKALGEAVAAGNYRLKFARYDFACIWYLHSKGKSLEEIRALFPLNEVAGLATTTLDAMTGNPIGAFLKAALDFGVEDWSERLTLLFAKQGVDRETQAHIRGLDLDRELVGELPRLFADDLNASMQRSDAPERLVLFFDTHEAFWGEQRDLPPASYFFRDEWLRRLLRGLNLDDGIVVVVAGRDVPRWADARAVQPGTEIPAQYVQIEEVGYLAAADAQAYLQKVFAETEIKNAAGYEALCEGLITFASVNPHDAVDEREVHPLHLGLCADVVLEAAVQGTMLTADDFEQVPGFDEKGKALIERLLSYAGESLRYAVHSLSACRAFDREIYKLLGEKLNFVADEPTFRRLVRFSFVWRSQQRGDEWYRIHDLLRRLDDEPEVKQAHKALVEYFQAQSSLERIYHVNQLDWIEGTYLWIQAFEKALALSKYEICRTLLDLRQELNVESFFKLGLISNAEGRYFESLALYKAAQQKFEEAVSAYNRAISADTEEVEILNNKSNSLRSIADILHIAFCQDELALQKYDESIAACNQALRLRPNAPYILNNTGLTLVNKATLQVDSSLAKEAQRSYEQAVIFYDRAIAIAPNFKKLRNNRGLALKGLADCHAARSQYPQSEQLYQDAVAAYDEAIRLDSNYVLAMTNKGVALESMADLYVENSQYSQAQDSYIKSIAAQDAALRIAPSDVRALNNKGILFLKLGDLLMKQSQRLYAMTSYRNALFSFKKSLEIAPENVQIREMYQRLLRRLEDHNS